MTLALEQIQDLAGRELDDAQVARVISELEPNFMGVRLGIGLIGGLAVLREELEAPLWLPPGQHIESISAEHDDRRLHIGMISRGEGKMGLHDIFVDDRCRRYSESIINWAGKLSYCVPGERTVSLAPYSHQ